MCRITLLVFLFGLSTSLLIDNARALEGEAIQGGDDTSPDEYTYQISLQIFGRNICGGSIIGSHHVVTAAHCVTDEVGAFTRIPMRIVGGINVLRFRKATRVAVAVEKVYIPRSYCPLSKKRIIGDIAVLKLSKALDINLNPNLSKLELSDPDETYAEEKAIVTGFGWNFVNVAFNNLTMLTEETGGGSLGKMRYAEADVISNSECLKRYTWRPVTESHVCAHVVQRKNGTHEGVCVGDSGGPLVHGGNTLIGVLSTSPIGCREAIKPSVYTRVSSYLDFIQKAIDDVEDPAIRFFALKLKTHVNSL